MKGAEPLHASTGLLQRYVVRDYADDVPGVTNGVDEALRETSQPNHLAR